MYVDGYSGHFYKVWIDLTPSSSAKAVTVDALLIADMTLLSDETRISYAGGGVEYVKESPQEIAEKMAKEMAKLAGQLDDKEEDESPKWLC